MISFLKQRQKLKELFYFYNTFEEFKKNFNIIIQYNILIN